jgi:hypothetical protein
MANEITADRVPGAQLAVTGKQFLREAYKQAFDRIGGVDAIVDWVYPEVEVYQKDLNGKYVLDENGEKIVVRTERKRNNDNFGSFLSLMTRLEPKEINIKDDRSIEATLDAIDAEFEEVKGDEPASD